MNTEQVLKVNGMTCSHCAQVLTEALTSLRGVRSADVDAAIGQVVLHVDDPVDPAAIAAIAAAIAEAGFELISSRGRPQ